MPLRVNKSLIPKAVNLDKFESEVSFEYKHVKDRAPPDWI